MLELSVDPPAIPAAAAVVALSGSRMHPRGLSGSVGSTVCICITWGARFDPHTEKAQECSHPCSNKVGRHEGARERMDQSRTLVSDRRHEQAMHTIGLSSQSSYSCLYALTQHAIHIILADVLVVKMSAVKTRKRVIRSQAKKRKGYTPYICALLVWFKLRKAD